MPTCDFPEGSICHKRKTPGWSRAEQGGLDQLCFGVPSDGPASRTQGRACTEPPHREGLEYASAGRRRPAGVGVVEGEATGKGRCPRRLSRGLRTSGLAKTRCGGGRGRGHRTLLAGATDARCGDDAREADGRPRKRTDAGWVRGLGTGGTRDGPKGT